MSANKSPQFAQLNSCQKCNKNIGFLRRNWRHHCRSCGMSFCNSCSLKTSVIPEYGFDFEVRVCDLCYEQIQESLNPSTTVRQSMFLLDEEEALDLAIAISRSEIETRNGPQNINESNKPQCPICFDDRLEYALKNCGHVVCGECLTKIEECPLCRKHINGAIRIYITN